MARSRHAKSTPEERSALASRLASAGWAKRSQAEKDARVAKLTAASMKKRKAAGTTKKIRAGS